MSADQTCCISLISLLRLSIWKVMDRFASDKEQVKGVVLGLLPNAGVWSTRCVEKWAEPKCKAVGGPVPCKYSRWCASRLGTSLRNSDALKKEALGATGDLLGQDGASAQNDYTFHDTLWCFCSFNDLTPLLTTHSRSSSWGKSQQANDGKGLCSEWNLWALTDKSI